ncbi:MAG: glycosyltransferase family A protein [Clostridium sp.]
MEKQEKALLTIIVPAYNVEAYIEECLNSLVNQTVRNHKIIIVNDGSTDKTEEKCLKYKEEYEELITYVYQDNKGLGGARNTGMQYVDTPYLTFLDSDDWLSIKFVEKFSKLMEWTDEKPEMVFTLPWVFDSVTNRILSWKDKEIYDSIFEVKENKSYVKTNVRKNPELYKLEVNSCRKIYKTEFLEDNKFFFPEKLKWEDVPGHFYLLNKANTCMALPEVGFFYRTNQGGQITSGGGKTRLDMVPIFEQLLKVQEENNFIEIERAYVLRLILDFSLWSVEATNVEYIVELLNKLHIFWKKIDKNDLQFYLDNLSQNKEVEKGFVASLMSENYLKLKEYDERYDVMRKYSRVFNKDGEKRNIIKGGLKCVQEHGLKYTISWALEKSQLR